MSEAVNPYESPQIAAISNSQASVSATNESPDARIAALEARVAQLEQRLAKSWFLSSLFYRPIIAVWGNLMLGYIVIIAVAMPVILFLEWLARRL